LQHNISLLTGVRYDMMCSRISVHSRSTHELFSIIVLVLILIFILYLVFQFYQFYLSIIIIMVDLDETNMTTGDIIVDKLIKWNVDIIFGIIGDGINPVINSLHKRQDKIKFITVRHEEGGALMASGYAKFTNRLSAVIGTTGPGMIHLLNGLYDASTDSAAVIAITGMSNSNLIGTMYPQDVKTVDLLNEIAHFNVIINGPQHALRIMDCACRTALDTHGISHISIPVDTQNMKLKDDIEHKFTSDHRSTLGCSFGSFLVPTLESVQNASVMINNYTQQQKKIFMLVGRGCANATTEVLSLAEIIAAPFCKSLYAMPLIPSDHPYCTGGIGFLGTKQSYLAMKQCDLLIILGSNFPFVQYYPEIGHAACIQIDRDSRKIGLKYSTNISIIADIKFVLSELIPLLNKNPSKEFLKSMQTQTIKWNNLMQKLREDRSFPLKPEYVITCLNKYLRPDANISLDTGEHTTFAARHLNFQPRQRLVLSGGLQTMGGGLPFAIAAALAYPERQSVAIVGDGGFTMLMGEIATAVKYNLDIKVIIFKNNTLALEYTEQVSEGFEPYGYELQPIEFSKVAEACGAVGYKISRSDDMDKIFSVAFESARPTIIEVVIDPDHRSPVAEQIDI
jgi:pyruvate dehydrogenase (quinone)